MEKILERNEGKLNYMQLEDEIDIEESKSKTNSPGLNPRSRGKSEASKELRCLYYTKFLINFSLKLILNNFS